MFAAALVASGCQTQTSVVDGSGFEMLHPSAGTRKFIVANDLPFAQEVVAHNETCAKQPGCKKD
jgi:hypothetical protein